MNLEKVYSYSHPTFINSENDSIVQHKQLLQKLIVEEDHIFDPSQGKECASPRQPLDIDYNTEKGKEEDNGIMKNKNTRAQFRALIWKSFALQSKQRGTNICQVTLK